jgi:hypothetical protein
MSITLFVVASTGDGGLNDLEVDRAPSGVVLCLDGPLQYSLPPGWDACRPDDLVEPESVRRMFLDFLERWPHRASPPDQSLDDLLTVDGKYSVWWTSVAAHRQPDHGSFRYFRLAALVDRAIERYAPTTIRLLTADPLVVLLIRSRAAQAGIPVELARGSPTEHMPSNGAVGMGWWLASTIRALTYWAGNVIPTLWCRWTLRAAQWKPSPGPVVAFASRFEQYLRLQDGTLSLLSWREISEAIAAADSSIQQVFLPRALERVVADNGMGGKPRRGIEAVRRARAPLLVHEGFIPVRGQLASVIRHLTTSWRFFRLARSRHFWESFRFAGTDMAPVLVPDLRDSVARIVEWRFRTGQLRCALRAAGDLRAVLVTEEMYPWSMPVLAAAAALGVPTVGVQHGNMMPAHLTYRVPRGHIRYAPTPDYLAVYGPYAKDVVAGLGAFSPASVWITGAGRLDRLVNRRIPKNEARSRLDLPSDKRVVVLATQTFPWFLSAIRSVLSCASAHPDVVLCLKKHQSSRAMSADALRGLAAEIGATDVRVFENDLELLLFASDVWISASSTTILEATLIGTRSICLNFSGEPDRYPYVEDGASLPARNAEELARSFSRALESESNPGGVARRLTFLARHAGPTSEGRAASTLAERVVELCQSPGRTRVSTAAQGRMMRGVMKGVK